MTRDDIIVEMKWFVDSGLLKRIERVVQIAVKEEREACAKLCEETTASWSQSDYNHGCVDCAKAIRARGDA